MGWERNPKTASPSALPAATADTPSSPAIDPGSAGPPLVEHAVELIPPGGAPVTAAATAPVAAAAALGKKGKAALKHMAFMERIERKVFRGHAQVLAYIPLAADVDDNGKKPEGWTDRMFRIAKDARKSQRECPKYLDVAQKVVDSYKRVDAMRERDPAPQLNCDIQVFVQQNVYNYEVLESEDDKK